jgi:hypothetical protein
VKILFDECVPRRLRRLLPEHVVETVQEAGWKGVTNGTLLKKAAERYEVFLTVDRNLAFQQNLANLHLCVIVIHSRSNRFIELAPYAPAILKLLESTPSKSLHHIEAKGKDIGEHLNQKGISEDDIQYTPISPQVH